MNLNKCSFCVSNFECLEYLVDGSGFRPDMKRLALYSENLTELRSLVGAFPDSPHFIHNVSRKLTVTELGYSQTQREALTMFRAVKRIHKYLFEKKFTIVTDHKALKFIHCPEKSISLQDRSVYASDCFLVQPLPVRRPDFIRETSRYFESILSAIRKGWNASLKRRIPGYFTKRDELSTTCDASTFNELERRVNAFLLQYRNAKHSVKKETHSKLLEGGILRSTMSCLESAEVTYNRGIDLRPTTGIVVKDVGKSVVGILDINDLSMHDRYIDRIRFQEAGESDPILVDNSNIN
ncbi:unnamed protein product [Schistosoma curassoni]|uniref:RT_RNaseH domain-containing protein n=1 Tax=Schistosoma curassoni TaxID=6186 RepID=A0A183JE72_9TREM|nr:unnamed protein product [Schistosoma curassoni]